MKLNSEITIIPPPHSDANGNVIHPNPITISELKLSIIDNLINKTIHAHIADVSNYILLWSGKEYEELGDWTRNQVLDKLREKLGDDPAKVLRSLYPQTLEEHPNHPGTVLSKMIKSIGIKMTDSCSCRKHAIQMNNKGNDWCEENIDTIVGWLREEAKKRNWPFIDSIGKLMVGRAIKKSRKLLANQPVPDNDEDLDKE